MNQAGLTMMAKAFPSSLRQLGLVPANELRKVRRLMLGTDGLTNTGKTEFLLSAPGPKVIMTIDCSYDSVLDNPKPPASRRLEDAVFDEIRVATVPGILKSDDYVAYFKNFRNRLYQLLDTPEIRTICIDGDSDTWELQLLAVFGKLQQIPPMSYPLVDGPRRAMIKRCWESKKIIIATNKIKDKWDDVIGEDGLPIKDANTGRNVQEKVKGEFKRQGFRDQSYLWQIQIRHVYKAGETKTIQIGPKKGQVIGKTEPQWGIQITKCKPNTRLEGDELWGDRANFKGLVNYIYPEVSDSEWGF